MPAEAQKETFDAILTEALGEECSCQVVQSVQEPVSYTHLDVYKRQPYSSAAYSG